MGMGHNGGEVTARTQQQGLTCLLYITQPQSNIFSHFNKGLLLMQPISMIIFQFKMYTVIKD